MKHRVYVDGENLVHEIMRVLIEEKLIYKRADLTKFDVAGLLQDALGEVLESKGARYYSTKLRKVREPAYLAEQSHVIAAWNARWTPWVMNQGFEYIKSGSLKVRDSHRCRNCGATEQIFQEKGVDVRMATDIVFDALSKEVDRLVIVSSDSDLIPAITRAKSCGARVIYVAFKERLNRAIAAAADETRVYDRPQIITAYHKVKLGGQK